MKKAKVIQSTDSHADVAAETTKEKQNTVEHIFSANWAAPEIVPRKLWWYISFCVITIWIMLFIFLAQDWVLLACMFTASLALIITYLKAPTKVDYQLDYDTITINNQVLKLDNYYAYTIATTKISKTATQKVVLLLPRRHLGLSFQISLPDNPSEKKKVLSAFNQALPFDEAKSFLLHYQILDYITSLLRLNF